MGNPVSLKYGPDGKDKHARAIRKRPAGNPPRRTFCFPEAESDILRTMNLLPLALYLTAVGLALATLYFCYLLHRRFLRPYLPAALYYLVAFYAAGLVDLIGRYLAGLWVGLQPAETVLLLRHVFVFLMFPFLPLALYLFWSFVSGLLGEKGSRAVPVVFAAFWTLFFLTLVVTTKNFLGGRNTGFSEVLFAWLGRTALIFFILISGYLWLKAGKLEDPFRRRPLRLLGLAYVVGFGATLAASEIAAAPASAARPAVILLYFFLNLPPVFILKSYLAKSPPVIDASGDSFGPDIESFFEASGLSNREREIVRLILEGKSNKDISRELYISLHTVKNHAYRIYQKLGVKNRLQLARQVQKHIGGETGE